MVRNLKARTLRTARLKAHPEQDIFISREALAERWDVHIETIKRDEKLGRLIPFRIGGRRIRYRLDDILAVEAEAKIAAPAKATAIRKKALDIIARRVGVKTTSQPGAHNCTDTLSA
jgi:hypothetical protein